MNISREQRAEWQALADAATEGPWSYPSEILGLPCSTVFAGDPKRTHAAYVAAMGPHDGKFIAAARTAVPALLDALDATEAALDAAERQVKAVRELHNADGFQWVGFPRADKREVYCTRCHDTAPCPTIRALDTEAGR